MQDENKTPANEPQEVVGQYIRDDSREVTDCYVYSQPLPAAAMPRISQASQMPQKHSRRGLWIFLIIAMVLIIAVVVAALTARPMEDGGYADDGHDASSIVDIFRTEKTTIPRMQGEAGVSMTCTAPSGEKLSIQDVYAKVNPSTVLVVAESGDKASIGTGVIMTSDGYIITNAHVISGGKSCWIALDTGYPYDARLVGYDEEQDLAVLKAVDAEDLPVAEFGDSGQCRVGDTAYAIGNPLGVELRGTLTNGIISAINRDVQVEGRVMTLLQTTAALNNGNSGGPLINEYGQVIGINTLKMSGTGSEEEATVEGLGFALPSSDVCFVVNDLIATGRFRGIPTLGVTVTNSPDNGGQVVVYTVEDGYGAAEAGIQPGDVLLKADGQPLHQINDLMAVRRTHLVDDTMTLTVLRDGRVFDVEVPLYANKG